MPCALTPAIRCDFDVVSSGLPPPFPSLLLSPLVASAVSGLRTLFVWFCFFCFCYPPTLCFSISSLQPSSLSDPSPCLYTAGAYCFCGRSGIRTRDVLRFLHRLSEALIHFQRLIPNVAFNHSAILPFSFNVLRYLRSILPYFTCSLLILPSSIISCISCSG